jgi:hypothetical protein
MNLIPGLLHERIYLSFLHMDTTVVLKKTEPVPLGPDIEPPVHGFLMVKRVMDPSLPVLYPFLSVLLDLILNRGLQLRDQLGQGSVPGALPAREELGNMGRVLQFAAEPAGLLRIRGDDEKPLGSVEVLERSRPPDLRVCLHFPPGLEDWVSAAPPLSQVRRRNMLGNPILNCFTVGPPGTCGVPPFLEVTQELLREGLAVP